MNTYMAHLTESNLLTLARVRDLLGAEILCGDDLNLKVHAINAADLLSDVLATSKSGTLLLTGLVNTQVIRTAIIAELCGVVFVRGKKPGKEILNLAKETKIPVMVTTLKMFDAAGRLYAAIAERE
jgi:predicted transcriptional regulator